MEDQWPTRRAANSVGSVMAAAATFVGMDDFEVAEATYRQWCAGQVQDFPA